MKQHLKSESTEKGWESRDCDWYTDDTKMRALGVPEKERLQPN